MLMVILAVAFGTDKEDTSIHHTVKTTHMLLTIKR